MDRAADILFGRQGFAMGDLPHTLEIVGPGILNGPIKQHGRGRDRRKDAACGDRKNIPTRCRFKKHVPSPKTMLQRWRELRVRAQLLATGLEGELKKLCLKFTFNSIFQAPYQNINTL